MFRDVATKIIEHILLDGNYRALYDFSLEGVTAEEIIMTGHKMRDKGLLNDFKEYPNYRFGTGLVTDKGKDFWQAATDDSLFGFLYFWLRF